MNEPKLKLFRFHWLGNSEPSEGRGYDVADAFRRLGYGGGAIRALDWHEEVKEEDSQCKS